MNILNKIQKELKVPKGQVNAYGGFKYRSCEDILEAVKPLLDDATLILEDEIVQVGERYYIKATASLYDGSIISKATAFAREPEAKTKMDDAQVTGASSSYARKYALNGLFLIDDIKDADTQDNTKDLTTGRIGANKAMPTKNEEKFMEDLVPTPEEVTLWENKLMTAVTLKDLREFWKVVPPMVQDKLAGLKDTLKIKLK